MRSLNAKKTGFTLIELMVVISIIGFLSSIVLSSLSVARSKGRDAQRITQIRQLQTALELFYSDNGSYPRSGECGGTVPNAGWSNSTECMSSGRWLRDNTSNLNGYISSDPREVNNTTAFPNGAYFYFSGGYGNPYQWYMIVYTLENSNKGIEATDGVTAPDGTYFHYGSGSNGVITVGRGR
ncbi:hypothetical protein BH11PAT3_BH11PAT3_2810 [soil metagenome]